MFLHFSLFLFHFFLLGPHKYLFFPFLFLLILIFSDSWHSVLLYISFKLFILFKKLLSALISEEPKHTSLKDYFRFIRSEFTSDGCICLFSQRRISSSDECGMLASGPVASRRLIYVLFYFSLPPAHRVCPGLCCLSP